MASEFQIRIESRSTGRYQTVSLSDEELRELRLTLLRDPANPQRRLSTDEQRATDPVPVRLAKALAQLDPSLVRLPPIGSEPVIGDVDLGF